MQLPGQILSYLDLLFPVMDVLVAKELPKKQILLQDTML